LGFVIGCARKVVGGSLDVIRNPPQPGVRSSVVIHSAVRVLIGCDVDPAVAGFQRCFASGTATT
jgi:hypothetical protein